MQSKVLVVKSNIHFINQGIRLLESVSDDQYSTNNGPYNKSGIGRHFRHIIEHYFSLLSEKDSLVDYDARERDLRLESDRSFMISSLEKVARDLNTIILKPEYLDKTIDVRSNEGFEGQSPLSSSTIRREFQFLISHTVHHYALIGLILKTMGFIPEVSFGVAPSTLKHEQTVKLEVQAS